MICVKLQYILGDSNKYKPLNKSINLKFVFFIIIDIFIVMFDQFNASLMNENIKIFLYLLFYSKLLNGSILQSLQNC